MRNKSKNRNNVHAPDYRAQSRSISDELKIASNIIQFIKQLEQTEARDGWYFLPIGNNACFTESSRFLSANYDDFTLEYYSYASIHKLYEQLPGVAEELQEFLRLHEKPRLKVINRLLNDSEKQDILLNQSIYINCTINHTLTFYVAHEGCITSHVHQNDQAFCLFDDINLTDICHLNEGNRHRIETVGLPIYDIADLLMTTAGQALSNKSKMPPKFDVSYHLEVMLYKVQQLHTVLHSILSLRVLNLSNLYELRPYLQANSHEQLSPQSMHQIGHVLANAPSSIHSAIDRIAQDSEECGGNSDYFYVWLPNNRSLVVTLMSIDDEKEYARYVSNPNFLTEQAIVPSTYSCRLHINSEYNLAFCEYVDRDHKHDWAKTIQSPFDLYKNFIAPYLKLIRDLHTMGLTHGDITDSNIALSSRFKKAIFIDLKHLFEITKDNSKPMDHRRIEIEDLHDMCGSIESNAPAGFQNDHVLKMIDKLCKFIDRWGDYEASDNQLYQQEAKKHESAVTAMYGLDAEDPELELFARNHGFNITRMIKLLCEKNEIFKQAYLEYAQENSPNKINLYAREVSPSTCVAQNPHALYHTNSSSNPRVSKRDTESALQEEHVTKKAG